MGEHLSPADLAAREDVSVATIYSWNYFGTGPAYFRTGGSAGPVRYRLEDVLDWERDRMAKREREVAAGTRGDGRGP